MKPLRRSLIVLAVALVSLSVKLPAWWTFGSSWPNGTVAMHLQLGFPSIVLIDGSTSWGTPAEAALAIWNRHLSRIQFGVFRNSTVRIFSGDGVNNVFWSNTVFGRSFGSFVAVATRWEIGSRRTEGDVVFNTAYSWNSYRGDQLRAAAGGTLFDIRRVAIHEFGHVLGLDHPDEHGQSAYAIMNSRISDIDTVTADDIAGARFLYGTTPPVSAPGAPSGLSASSSGSTISLSWRAPTTGGAPTSYSIEAGTSPGLSNLANFSTGTTATSFSAAGAPPGTYYIRVRATNAAGTSAASNEAVLSVGGCVAPGAPSGLSVTVTGTTVTLRWTAGAGSPTSYVLEAGSAPGLANLAAANLGSSATSVTFFGIPRGTYFVRVRSTNACGTSGPSNEATIFVL